MCLQSQMVLWGIFIGIPQHHGKSLIYVPIAWKIFSSRDILFDKTFSIALAHISRPYSEELNMQP